MGNTMHVLDRDHGLLVGQIQNLGVIVWQAAATVDAVNRVTDLFPEFEVTPGQGFGLIAVVTPSGPPPSADARQAFDRGMRGYRDALLGIAVVIEVEGVMGGLSRAVARTMSIVSRAPYPLSTFATVRDASGWLPYVLSQRGAPTLEPEQLVREIDAGRATMTQ